MNARTASIVAVLILVGVLGLFGGSHGI